MIINNFGNIASYRFFSTDQLLQNQPAPYAINKHLDKLKFDQERAHFRAPYAVNMDGYSVRGWWGQDGHIRQRQAPA